MDKEIKKISESIDRSKTILLPKDLNSDCYAVYSKEEFNNPDEKLIVDGKAYKHRLYLYKKNPKSDSDKILTFIILNPGSVNHNDSDALTENCLENISSPFYREGIKPQPGLSDYSSNLRKAASENQSWEEIPSYSHKELFSWACAVAYNTT